MILITNVIVTSKGDRHLKGQSYIIFTTMIDEIVRVQLTKLHKRFTTTWPSIRKVSNIFLYLKINKNDSTNIVSLPL